MASTSRGRVAYLQEAIAGVLPATPAWQVLGVNSETLAYTKTTVESGKLDSTGQPVDTVKVGAKSAGNISFEWSPATFDVFLEAAFRSAFTSIVNATGAFVVSATAKTLTLTGAFTSVVPGQWVLLSGFTAGESFPGAGDSPNNGWWKVATRTSADAVVLSDPAGKLVSETASGAKVNSKRMVNGVRKVSHAVEVSFTDAQTHFAYLGQYVNTLAMTLSAGALVTGEMAFMGSDVRAEQGVQEFTGVVTITASTRTVSAIGAFARAVVGQKIAMAGFVNVGNNVVGEVATVVDEDSVTLTAATTTLVDETGPSSSSVAGSTPSWSATGSYTAETETGTLNATSNVGDIYIDGALSLACFKTLTWTVNNNLRETPCVGNEFPIIDYGTPALTGSFERLFTNLDLWRKMRNHETIAVEFGVVGATPSTGIHISIPEARINTDPVDLSGGNNTDIVDKVDWSASKHTDGGTGETYYVQVCVA